MQCSCGKAGCKCGGKKSYSKVAKYAEGGVVGRPMRAANARGLDRTALSDAKQGTALKSMAARFDNPKGVNAGLTLSQALGRRAQELNLFDEGGKLRKERNAIRNQTKRDIGDKGRR